MIVTFIVCCANFVAWCAASVACCSDSAWGMFCKVDTSGGNAANGCIVVPDDI